MNILFFLTPKEEVAYIVETDKIRQVLEKMELHGYTATPLLSEDGKYLGTITEGDLLWEIKDKAFLNLPAAENVRITKVRRHRDNKAVRVDETMEDLFQRVMNQNFVPVVDDENVFIGIVTRKDVLFYLAGKLTASAE